MIDLNSSSLTILFLSVSVLALGPILGELARRVKRVGPLLEGFVIGSVFSLVFFFLLPEAIEETGALALLFAGLGLVVLTLMERGLSMAPKRAHSVALAIGVLGLILHTTLDGFALAGSAKSESLLGIGVVIHRVPVAVTLWWLVRPRYGVRWALSALLLAGAFTIGGFFIGDEALAHSGVHSLALFQAFVAGTLLHVVFHGGGGAHGHDDDARVFGLAIPESLGAIAGVALVGALPSMGHEHGGHFEAYFERLIDLFLESAPALLLGYVIAGFVVVFFPRAGALWLKKGNAFAQASKGTLFGLPLPICSCGVVPVYQGLIKQGVPMSAAAAFLVATPELGLESILLSLPLLGAELTIARLLCAFLVALFIGTCMMWVRSEKDEAEQEVAHASERNLKEALRYGFIEVVDDTAAWICAGLFIAAAIPQDSLAALLTQLPPHADILLATLCAMPIYVCASGATPLAAALIFAGLSPGAAIAFLLSGPATNITTFGVLSKLHGRKAAMLFAGLMLVGACAAGALTNLLISDQSVANISAHSDEHGMLSMLTLAALSVLFIAAFLRQGPAHFLAPVLTFGDHHGHDDDEHGHHHSHGHDHSHGHHHHHHH